MSTKYKLLGISIMMISVFFLMLGLTITDLLNPIIKNIMTIGGFIFLIVGLIMIRMVEE